MTAFLISFTIAYLLLVWYRTDVVAEYSTFLPKFIKNRTFIGKYLLIKESNPVVHFNLNDFILKQYNDYFLGRLVSCPICLAFWLSFFFCLFIGLKFIFVVAFLSSVFYFYASLLSSRHD